MFLSKFLNSEEGLTMVALMFHVVVHYMHDIGFSPLIYIYIYIYIYRHTYGKH